jgi:cold shock CspA family protein
VAEVVGLRGEVIEFDEHAGLGRVRAEDGRVFAFHCTQLADGSRSVDVGAIVRFEVVPGHLGQWEAARVDKQ